LGCPEFPPHYNLLTQVNAQASTQVTRADDGPPGSLRAVLANALPSQTITFAPNLFGCPTAPCTIGLSSELVIDKPITIDGRAHPGLKISGLILKRVMNVNTTGSVTLRRLTITEGFAKGSDINGKGGGIFNNGATLTIEESTISSNEAFGNNDLLAGGIFNGDGGGIYNNGGILIVRGSTISGNISNQRLTGYTGGGGIHSNNGSVTVINSTIYDNVARSGGGGGIASNVDIEIINSTITKNDAGLGGNISNISGQYVLRNTIIANSITSDNCHGTVVDGGSNLRYGDTSCPGSIRIGDPKLALPSKSPTEPTETMALQAGSTAINGGNAAICQLKLANTSGQIVDQRGVNRLTKPQPCDIGAYESDFTSYPVTVNTVGDHADGNCGDSPTGVGDCSLRDAIAAANSVDIIGFHTSLKGQLILVNSEVLINKSLTIEGLDAPSSLQAIAIRGNNSRVFRVDSGSPSVSIAVTVRKLNISGGNGGGFNGGNILNRATKLTIIDAVISGGTAVAGGGISNDPDSTLEVFNSFFSANTTSSGQGGSIFNAQGGIVKIVNSTMAHAHPPSTTNASSIHNFKGDMTVINSTITKNNGIGIKNECF
jgi:CSLREA domain-containing protein